MSFCKYLTLFDPASRGKHTAGLVRRRMVGGQGMGSRLEMEGHLGWAAWSLHGGTRLPSGSRTEWPAASAFIYLTSIS